VCRVITTSKRVCLPSTPAQASPAPRVDARVQQLTEAVARLQGVVDEQARQISLLQEVNEVILFLHLPSSVALPPRTTKY